ncbi:MAG: pilin [bacterium]|nr:pilin [bacterium]
MRFTNKLLFLFLVLALISLPFLSLAQVTGDAPIDTAGMIKNPIPNINSLDGLIKKLLEGIIKIGIPVVALAIIYSGFLFVFAQGNSEKLDKAKSALLYSVIGAAVLLGSWAIAQLISETVLQLSFYNFYHLT